MSAAEFDGKVVIVTGAASGLGRAAARAFADAGATLVLGDVNAEGVAAIGEELEARTRVLAIAFDVSDTAAGARFIAQGVEAFGRIDALCNVAGIVRMKPLAQMTEAVWDQVIAVNARGPYFLIQAAMPHLVESGGAVVNVASSAAIIGQSYLSAYGASKAAMVNYTKALAMEFTNTPVRINALAPGGMNTGMVNMDIPEGIDFTLMQRFTGLRPPSEPEDVAGLIVYLASPRSVAVHGAVFSIDRGATTG
jgi:NAD(P)-dependent dehydrogenase (short-subunit alcohol dehydrogenase family)